MRKGKGWRWVATCAVVLVAGAFGPLEPTAGSAASAASASAGTTAQVAATQSSHSVRFEPNLGQTNSAARFVVRGAGPAAFLTATDAVFVLTKPAGARPDPSAGRATPPSAPEGTGGAVVRMHLRNANPDPQITTADALSGTTNYLIGNDRSRWITGVHAFGQVTYHDVYPGIDLTYHSGTSGGLEYDFVVNAGADPGLIDLEFQGADNVAAGNGGGLAVSTAAGELTWRAAQLYQDVNGSHHAVAGGYAWRPGHRVGFSVGSHDMGSPLVIDPLLTYSTYLGGSGGLGNEGTGIATDSSGNAYVTGEANSVADFPTTTGAFQSNFPGTSSPATWNAYVSKLSPNGTSLVYSTYLGGSGSGCTYCGDQASGIAVDSSGEAYITGQTTSPNFPVTSSGVQTSRPGQGGVHRVGFVTVLNTQGSALIYSTYLGGAGNGSEINDQGLAVAVDSSGDALVAGNTASPDFPTTSNAYQPACRSNCPNNTDGVSSGGSTTYTSATADFNSSDAGAAITGTNIPANTTVASVQTPTSITLSSAATASGTNLAFTVAAGARERSTAFLARINPTASGTASLVYSTRLSGSVGSSASGLTLDSSGNAYLTGSTGSADFPTTAGVYQPVCGRCDSFTDGTVSTKTLQSPTANFTQADVGSTVYGERLSINSHIAAVVNATTATLDLSAISAGSTNFTMDRPNVGASFVAELNPAQGQSGLVASTFFADSPTSTMGIAIDSSGATYLTGQTSSATFPTTAGAFETTCHQTTNSPCGTDPTFTDGATISGSTTYTSASAHFDPATDTRQTITGTNIQTGTTVLRVVNATSVVLSLPATATGSGLTFTLARNTGTEGFVTKLSAGATTLAYSTYLGGVSTGLNNGIVVDSSGRAVVVGESYSGTTYPLKDQVAPFECPAISPGGCGNATVTEMAANGSSPVFSSFLGSGDGLALSLDSTGEFHATGNTNNSDFPTTPGAFQTAYGGSESAATGNAFVVALAPVASSSPIVTGVNASHGALTGGDTVVITGHGFTGASAVNFSGSPVSAYTVNSDTQVTTSSPSQAAPPSGTTLVDGVTVTTSAGTSPDNPVDRFTYGVGRWTATGALSLPRQAATATLLNSGKVLVAGGTDVNPSTPGYASAEVYDPVAGTWSPTGSMSTGRVNHTATLLNNGKVLVVGGNSSAAAASAEIYDPNATGCGTGITGCWSVVAPPPIQRTGSMAALLSSGKVLVVGGGTSTSPAATAVVYDPTANTWTTVGPMATPRLRATATLLPSGKVLVVGGCCVGVPFSATATAELFDPAATGCGTGIVGCWTATGSLGQGREYHTATLLQSGQVLVTGGTTVGAGSALTSMERYDPSTGAWTLVGLMQHPRVGHTATLLSDGKVLLTGGLFAVPSAFLSTAELVDPANPGSTMAADRMLVGRGEWNGADEFSETSFTTTLLQSGQVLATGGSTDATAEVYTESVPTAPTVTGISPTSGTGTSATTITITGTNLSSVTTASFGTNATSAVTHDPTTPNTKLYVANPGTTNSAGGTVDVTVTGPGGTSATSSADHYTFNPWGYLRVTTPSGGLPSQVSADGNFLDTWATTWVHMDTGSHQVCFSDVQGWTTPTCSSVNVTQGATTTVNGSFTQRGFLQVQESPAGVDGTVSVDGNPTDDYGMYTDLPTGSHQVCFSAAANYTPPACQNVSVNAGATTQVTGTYVSNPGAPGQSGTGFLRATTNPPLPSQISVDGIPRDTWGLVWLQLAAGPQTHTVCFRSVQGYTAPACSTVTITAGQTTTVQGNFTQRGFLQVQESPAGVDGVVSVDGIARDDYGMYTDVPTGSHTVCWGAVSGHTAPACQNVSVNAGATTTITGTYT